MFKNFIKITLISISLLIFLKANTYSQTTYKNAEECILDKVTKTNNNEASLAVIEICKKLYPELKKSENITQTIDKQKLEQEIKKLAEIMGNFKKRT